LVSGHASAVHRGNLVEAVAFSFHVVVVVGANKVPMLHHLGEGWPTLPSPLDVVRNSLVKSSIMTRYGVDAPL
jgi:hypothetical protein